MTAEEADAIKETFGVEPEAYQDGGNECIVLPVLRLPTGCKPPEAMAIFVRGPVGGYQSRLFFEVPITLSNGSLPTIHSQMMLGREMHAASIQGIPPTLPPHQAILAHLQQYKK